MIGTKSVLPGGNGALEDSINTLILQGVSRSHVTAELIRLLAIFLGRSGVLLVDEEDSGELSGLIIANALITEAVAEICTAEGWKCTDICSDVDPAAAAAYPYGPNEIN